VHPHAGFGNMHCMNADLSDLLRLLQNLIRLGTIAEINGAKARVRLGPTLTTEWLNWATRRAGSTHTWSAPTVGEQVIVISPGGDLTRGIIVPALYSQEFDAPETSDTIHTTHSPDGAVVQYDHAAHALTATLPGGTATITADKVTSNTPSSICTGDLTVMKNLIVMQAATVNGATALNGGVNAKAGAAGGDQSGGPLP
jgi:phage baseplate assembly protein V